MINFATINSAKKSTDNKPNYLKVNKNHASITKHVQEKSQQLPPLTKVHLRQNNYVKNINISYVSDAAIYNDPKNLMQFQDLLETENKDIEYFSSLDINLPTRTLDHSNPDKESAIDPIFGKSPFYAMTSLKIVFSTSGLDHSNQNKESDIEPTLEKSPSNAMAAENMQNDQNDLMLSKAFQEPECEEMEYFPSSNTDMIAILHEEMKIIDTYNSNITPEGVYKRKNPSFIYDIKPGELIASTYIDQYTTPTSSKIDFYSTFFTQYDNASQTPSITSSSDINTPPTPDWEKNSSQSK